jgi:hypothetical protein
MYQTIIQPQGLTGILPLLANEYEQEVYDILTAQEAMTGSNPATNCGIPPVSGNLKKCRQIFEYGLAYWGTNVINLTSTGGLRDRADMSRQIINQSPTMSQFTPEIMATYAGDTRDEFGFNMFKAGTDAQRFMERVAITGNPATAYTSTALGLIKEPKGLDLLINDNYTTPAGVACDAANSTVVNFSAEMGDTIGGGDGRGIVQVMTDIYYSKMDTASKLGIRFTGFWLMTAPAFRELTNVWACNYSTARCDLAGTNNRQNTDAMATTALRIDMYNNRYLLIDGVRVPVEISDGIPQGYNGTTYTQDIYFVPLTSDVSPLPLTRFEYHKMDNQYAQQLVNRVGGGNVFFSNNGLYAVAYQQSAFCVQYYFSMRPRLVMDTPFLAGRVNDVSFTFLADTRSPYADESNRYYGGGDTFVPNS